MSHILYEHLQVQTAQAIEAPRAAIAEGLRLIAHHEDGPYTMHCQIKEIDECVDGIETQVRRLVTALECWAKVTTRLEQQRDEALRQRDLLIGLFEQLNDAT